MDFQNKTHWHEMNRKVLFSGLAEVRTMLSQKINAGKPEDSRKKEQILSIEDPSESNLNRLCNTFNLSPFERNILLLCAGIELQGDFTSLCAKLQGEEERTFPTFALALIGLADSHWSAFTPDAPLRQWNLIKVKEGQTLLHSPIRIDEFVLHFLLGFSGMDKKLKPLLRPVKNEFKLVPSHEKQVDKIVRMLNTTDRNPPVVQLWGEEDSGKLHLATSVCARLNSELVVMPESLLPQNLMELEEIIGLWTRETLLNSRALMIECWADTEMSPERQNAMLTLLEKANGLLFLSCRERKWLPRRESVAFEVKKPTRIEQRELWQGLLKEKSISVEKLECLVAQFNLGESSIRSAWQNSLGDSTQAELENKLWSACRLQSRKGMGGLAQPIRVKTEWDELVLPQTQIEVLGSIISHVRYRQKVYESWGFQDKLSRGLGISALFSGGSGTGKTMAAGVLANELQLDLYRVDLSSVISKYIGETEKHLCRLFDQAEESGAILLFDEADALFGKRSQVKDSHDRYANIEVSYLLQRMEEYRGLAILTTNLKDGLDSAFLRRIRFIVSFPFPDEEQRKKIWEQIFPRETPAEKMDMDRLSKLNLCGGNIRNIALNAAFLAAEANTDVSMNHLFKATQKEYHKMERSLTALEIEEWGMLE